MSLMKAVNKGCSGTYRKVLLGCLFPTSEVRSTAAAVIVFPSVLLDAVVVVVVVGGSGAVTSLKRTKISSQLPPCCYSLLSLLTSHLFPVTLSLRRTYTFSQAYTAYALFKAFEGMGTDEDRTCRLLGGTDKRKIPAVASYYLETYGRSIVEDLKDEISGKFLQVRVIVPLQDSVGKCMYAKVRHLTQ